MNIRRGESRRTRGGHASLRHQPSRGVSLRECCRRIGVGYRTGERYVADGRFPVPELKRLTPRSPHRFSTVEIDLYLAESSVEEAR